MDHLCCCCCCCFPSNVVGWLGAFPSILGADGFVSDGRVKEEREDNRDKGTEESLDVFPVEKGKKKRE